MPLKEGDISLLHKVMSFAVEKYATQMHDLLLQYAAFEKPAGTFLASCQPEYCLPELPGSEDSNSNA